MQEIAPNVWLMSRHEWDTSSLPRLGALVSHDDRVEAILHHTVILDGDDNTPNLWTDIDEVKYRMRQLQTIRPDLGLDVPYNYVVFFMEDGRVILCEGRGAHRRAAHTRYHNRTGVGIAIQGNLQLSVDVGRFVQQLSWVWGYVKYDEGLRNLGNVKPDGRAIFGHLDFRDPNDTRTWTVCPGASLMAVISRIRIEQYQEEENMPTLEELQTQIDQIKQILTDTKNVVADHTDAIGALEDLTPAHIEELAGMQEALDVLEIESHAELEDWQPALASHEANPDSHHA